MTTDQRLTTQPMGTRGRRVRQAEQEDDSPAARLDAAIAAARARGSDRPRVASVVTPIGSIDPIDLLAAATRSNLDVRLWLRPADGFGLVGIGSAWSIAPDGPDRFDLADRAWRGLVDDAVVDAPAASPSVTGPLLVGGFPFRSATTRPAARGSVDRPSADGGSASWTRFETASLELPRFLVTLVGGLAWLTVSVVVPDAAPRSRAIVDDWYALIADVRPIPLSPPSAILRMSLPAPAAEWQATVARLAGAVGRGRMDKVVLARRVDALIDQAIDVPAVLRRLESSAPESTIFAVTRSGRTFLGATPERLAWVAGGSLATVALAGSARRDIDSQTDDRLADALLASEKEREEHRVVVDELRATLEPLAASLDIPAVPHVVRFRHVQHLETPIRGTFEHPRGVLPLVAALHPTPAVGGAPRELALELIDEQERLDRGWYAGPFGWVDRHGDGEFVVAIRSGVVHGGEASLFAGCGIVADSDPAREWDESEMKLRALASALGELR